MSIILCTLTQCGIDGSTITYGRLEQNSYSSRDFTSADGRSHIDIPLERLGMDLCKLYLAILVKLRTPTDGRA